ncbi:protein translocase subunit SecF [Alphaproteobacteria bacterium]|jgi:preprotein translocase SecF subunit|nr:protein translocase subunit SecF [Alphaproteobacteria bacterium]|tara:strand:- start:909 stop:1856 length:948 start_codon:yes stop_codon:yes gene_type:complete
MKLLRLIPSNTNIDFLSIKKFAFLFSILIISGTFLSLFFNNLNYGIDFKGGILLEVRAKNYEKSNINELRNKVLTLKAGEISIQKFGKEGDYLIRIQKQEGDQKQQIAMIEKVKLLIDNDYSIRRSEFVGPTVGDELKIAGIYAVSLSLLAIMVYIWFRFEWQFSIAAIIALIHDVISTVGLFSFLQLEFNLATIAAILTTAGYSINDTVVIFDRVRENLRRYKSKDHYYIYNKSINETLSRTVITSVTTLIALFIIFFFGGAVLSDFALAMIWGVLIGTFSSIFVAVSILTFFDINKGEKVEDQSNVPEYERDN